MENYIIWSVILKIVKKNSSDEIHQDVNSDYL